MLRSISTMYGLKTPEQLVLEFDGETIRDSDTAEDLEIEDDFIIDVKVGFECLLFTSFSPPFFLIYIFFFFSFEVVSRLFIFSFLFSSFCTAPRRWTRSYMMLLSRLLPLSASS